MKDFLNPKNKKEKSFFSKTGIGAAPQRRKSSSATNDQLKDILVGRLWQMDLF
ncbi:TPA: hypothetical protein U2K93_002000 [Enterococcus faecalis]|nr:hypothetical protein [Enterococcus faecium]HEM7700335.1 hypothetical protein [Enterococcus faecalis]